MSADANHMTAPCEDGDGARRCMLAALKNAGMNPEDIQYVNAHGTSTPLVTRQKQSPSSVLSVTTPGNCCQLDQVDDRPPSGCAGGIEAVFSALAIYHQISPPTINIFNQDEQCDLDYCANEARQMKIDAAISTFGFGGTNGSVVFRRSDWRGRDAFPVTLNIQPSAAFNQRFVFVHLMSFFGLASVLPVFESRHRGARARAILVACLRRHPGVRLTLGSDGRVEWHPVPEASQAGGTDRQHGVQLADGAAHPAGW